MKQSREAPLGWGELLATVCLVGTMGGAAFWLCCKILAWASASPTMILMRPD